MGKIMPLVKTRLMGSGTNNRKKYWLKMYGEAMPLILILKENVRTNHRSDRLTTH